MISLWRSLLLPLAVLCADGAVAGMAVKWGRTGLLPAHRASVQTRKRFALPTAATALQVCSLLSRLTEGLNASHPLIQEPLGRASAQHPWGPGSHHRPNDFLSVILHTPLISIWLHSAVTLTSMASITSEAEIPGWISPVLWICLSIAVDMRQRLNRQKWITHSDFQVLFFLSVSLWVIYSASLSLKFIIRESGRGKPISWWCREEQVVRCMWRV